MVVMEDNKPDPKEFVDKLYNKLIQIHVLDPDWGYVGMTTHAVREVMRIMVNEMTQTIVKFGGVHDEDYWKKVRLYIDAK
jgi:hypothetical protein